VPCCTDWYGKDYICSVTTPAPAMQDLTVYREVYRACLGSILSLSYTTFSSSKNRVTFSFSKAVTLFMFVNCGILTERLRLLIKSIIQSLPERRFRMLNTWLMLLVSANSQAYMTKISSCHDVKQTLHLQNALLQLIFHVFR
jgi:hypothetical protein